MKNFQQYLAESERTYNYRIKIVGDVAPDFIKQLSERLSQFDVVKISKPKTTPVQLKPADFPKHSNDSVTSMDVEFRYPATDQTDRSTVVFGSKQNHHVDCAT